MTFFLREKTFQSKKRTDMSSIADQYKAQTTPQFLNTTISATPPPIQPLDYLIFANNAYKDTKTHIDPPEPWELASEEADNINGYAAIVYVNKKTKQIVIAHRGTDTANMLDQATDIMVEYPSIGKGTLGPQVKSAIKFTEKILKKYKGYQVSHTGHSLGGYIAEVLASRTKSIGVSFDSPGGGRTIALDGILHGKYTSQITAYVSDPNIVNFFRGLPFSEVGTVYNINQGNSTVEGSSSSVDTHDIYGYMRQFFDTETRQLRLDCFPNAISKTVNAVTAKQEQLLTPSKDGMNLATEALVGAGSIYVYKPRN